MPQHGNGASGAAEHSTATLAAVVTALHCHMASTMTHTARLVSYHTGHATHQHRHTHTHTHTLTHTHTHTHTNTHTPECHKKRHWPWQRSAPCVPCVSCVWHMPAGGSKVDGGGKKQTRPSRKKSELRECNFPDFHLYPHFKSLPFALHCLI